MRSPFYAVLPTLLLLALSSFDITARAAEIHLPLPQIETLPNGLQLVWFLNDSLPLVDLVFLVKSGFRDDPSGKSGTAEFLAASLDRGAGGLSAQQFAHHVEMLGASRFVSADEDTFNIGMHGLAPDAPRLLELLAQLALHPDFPEAELSREHARILDRWTHIPDYGEALANLTYRRAVSAATIYGRGSFLSSREFDQVTRADVITFYQKHFVPANAVLMVVGRVQQAEFRKEILRLFGNADVWKGSVTHRQWRVFADPRLTLRKNSILLVDRPHLTQAQVRLGFKAPLIGAPEHYPLVVANALLGEYFNSRLNSLLRDKLGLTYGVGSSFAYSQELGIFTVSAATRNESVGQLIEKATELLRDLKKGPISGEEVQTAKEYLEGGFPLGAATLGAVASRWLAGYIYDLGPGYLNEFVPKIRAVTAEQVMAAVVKDLDLDSMVIAVAGDAPSIFKSLSESKKKTVIRIQAKDLL
ncbi:pitrilysin family protein [Bdellovibrionota bacterium FG-1]